MNLQDIYKKIARGEVVQKPAKNSATDPKREVKTLFLVKP